ncbi:MAG: ATP synthase F1 subunit delta [Spirochaetes bacterium]|nr:ATP synthase F1 subunit delta [Spirochaetota bacterium]
MIGSAAHNYALALSQIPGLDLKTVEEELHLVRNALREDDRFAIFLASPRISTAAKKKALTAMLSGKVQKAVLNLCLILTEKRKTVLLSAIFIAYRKVLDGILGRTYIDVTVAKEIAPGGIDEELKQAIVKKVDSNRPAFGLVAGKALQYDVSVKLNPELLAGVRVRVADYIFDGTVMRNLIHWHDVAIAHPIDVAKAIAE